MADEPADRPRPRPSPAAIAAAVIGLAIPVAAVAVAYKACRDTTIRGSISIRGDGPDWRRTIDGCAADPVGLDVVLSSRDQPLVRVILDPLDGPRAIVTRQPDVPILLTPATCPGLHVTLRASGTRDDGSQLVDGSVTAACLVGAARVVLDAWWRSCHEQDPDE